MGPCGLLSVRKQIEKDLYARRVCVKQQLQLNQCPHITRRIGPQAALFIQPGFLSAETANHLSVLVRVRTQC